MSCNAKTKTTYSGVIAPEVGVESVLVSCLELQHCEVAASDRPYGKRGLFQCMAISVPLNQTTHIEKRKCVPSNVGGGGNCPTNHDKTWGITIFSGSSLSAGPPLVLALLPGDLSRSRSLSLSLSRSRSRSRSCSLERSLGRLDAGTERRGGEAERRTSGVEDRLC